MQFENDTFNRKITETGSILSDETAEAQQKKWQTMIESTDLHTAAENVENHQHHCRRTTSNFNSNARQQLIRQLTNYC